MSRTIPFFVKHQCIDCGAKHTRCGVAWRCWPCDRATNLARANGVRAVSRAIAAGELPPPHKLGCADCESDAQAYDHRDYGKPLQVDAVCDKCNQRRGPAAPVRSPATPEPAKA